MLRSFSIIFTFIFSFGVFAQLNPKKIKNNDLRGTKEIISISFSGDKKNLRYFINKSSMGDYQLSQSENNKTLKSIKLGSDEGQTLDDSFVDKFVTMKYMMEGNLKEKCEKSFDLSMRGEDLKVCSEDAPRMAIVNELINLFKGKLI